MATVMKKCECGMDVAAQVEARHKKGKLHKARMAALKAGETPPEPQKRSSSGKKTTRRRTAAASKTTRRRRSTTARTTSKSNGSTSTFDASGFVDYVASLEEDRKRLNRILDAANS